MALGMLTGLIGLPFQLAGNVLGGIGGGLGGMGGGGGGGMGGGFQPPPPPPPQGMDPTVILLAVAGLGAVILLKK